ncbi:MAG: hypothetical protein KatS3mg090_0973 [Patescibacteria group bacterium]|nr:MAG: hypothetical protein KatS3mg090_0973 [Patescibacteria group bacterium]
MIIGASWEFFGQDFFGLRLPAVIFSVAGLFLLFYLLHKITNNLVVSTSFSMLTATNLWFLNFSRSGWENIFVCVSYLLNFIGFYHFFIEKRHRLGFVEVFVAAVSAFFFYHPGKMFLLANLIIFSLALASSDSKEKLKLVRYTVALFLVVLLLSLVLLAAYAYFPAAYSRIHSVSVFLHLKSVSEFSRHILRNVFGMLTFLGPFFKGTVWERYIPDSFFLIHFFVIPFYWLGLVISIKKYWYYFVFYLIVFLPVNMLSVSTPDAVRIVHNLPAVFLFAGIG